MRLFIGIEIPEELKNELFLLQKKIDFSGIKLVEKENFHFCLKFIGEFGKEKLNELIESMDETISGHSKFKINMEGLDIFPNEKFPRTIIVKAISPEMEELAKKLNASLSSINIPLEQRKFVPHITLGRVKKQDKILSEEIQKFLKDNPHINFKDFEATYIILYKSELSTKGPKYYELKKFRLKEN